MFFFVGEGNAKDHIFHYGNENEGFLCVTVMRANFLYYGNENNSFSVYYVNDFENICELW